MNNNQDIHCRFMHTALIINDFVEGNYNNYELYLIEFLNSSNYFMSKNGNKKFVYISKQSNGECDCIAGDYELDFKRLISSSQMKYLSLTTPSLMYEKDLPCIIGSESVTQSKNIKELLYIPVENLFKGFQYDSNNYKLKKEIEDNIDNIKRILSTKKNVFFYLPYDFFKEYPNNVNEKEVNDILNIKFKELFLYRDLQNINYDSFLATFINTENLVIFKWENKQFKYLETLKFSDSETFNLLFSSYIGSKGKLIKKCNINKYINEF